MGRGGGGLGIRSVVLGWVEMVFMCTFFDGYEAWIASLGTHVVAGDLSEEVLFPFKDTTGFIHIPQASAKPSFDLHTHYSTPLHSIQVHHLWLA